ncbi:MAG TPA: TetR/AcrR family transcriptional regulator [Pseudonocardia sp.]|jgi:AcrR family transcriptional regulator
MARDTKQRMVSAAAELLRTRGLAAMSFTEVLADSGAARGAIYHHFPGGKVELARHAVAWTGSTVREHLAALEADRPAAVVAAFLASVRPVVEQSAGGAGCAVAAVTGESAQLDPELMATAHAALRSWITALEAHLVRTGADADSAGTLATLMITFLEGAHVLCRAAGSIAPFDQGAPGITAAAAALLDRPR